MRRKFLRVFNTQRGRGSLHPQDWGAKGSPPPPRNPGSPPHLSCPSHPEGGQTPLDTFQLPAGTAREDASSPQPEPAGEPPSTLAPGRLPGRPLGPALSSPEATSRVWLATYIKAKNSSPLLYVPHRKHSVATRSRWPSHCVAQVWRRRHGGEFCERRSRTGFLSLRAPGWGRTYSALQNVLPEPASPVQEKQAAPPDKDEAPPTRGKGIKVEPGWGETKDTEDSGDEEPAGPPAPPRREFTSVIRTGALKQDLVRPWGLVSPGDPPPSLLHAGFLPPVMRGLCTPSTIRYGPTELGLMYPHLQRLGPGPSFPEAFYPPLGLPYPGPTSTRVQRKGD